MKTKHSHVRVAFTGAIGFLGAAALSASFATASSLAPQWSCEPEAFTAPSVVEDGMFRASLQAPCVIKTDSTRGLSYLFDELKRRAVKVDVVHSGPVEIEYQGLPGVQYDVSFETLDEKGKPSGMKIRQDVFIASDGKSVLIYETLSKSIQASGFAGWLKKLDVRFRFETTSTAGEYNVVLGNTIHVKKPGLIPSKGFKGPAEKIAREQFGKARDANIPELAGLL